MDLDELDIYDDLDTFHEEEEKKSAELLALEAKYNESLKANEALQTENADLKKQIKRIGINFQNLLDTAKAEIKRKDKQIEQLRKEKDDICFRRKQLRAEYYRETGGTQIDNWYKTEQKCTKHDAKLELNVKNESKNIVKTVHARDPRVRERKHENEMHPVIDTHLHVPNFGAHSREYDECGHGVTRRNSRDSRAKEYGRRDEYGRRLEYDRREERDRRDVRNYRVERNHGEERERNLEQNRWTERNNRSIRSCSSEKEKHTYASKYDGNNRRHHSLEKIVDRIRQNSKEDKSRSSITDGNQESRNDCNKITAETRNPNDKKQPQYNTHAKSAKAVGPKSGEAVLLSKDNETGRMAENSNCIEISNINNMLCNKLPRDEDMLDLNEKSITKNNSLTKEKLLALDAQFNDKTNHINSNNTFSINGMITPKKTTLYNSLFGSTPNNAENVNNTMLSNVMVLLKNNCYTATTSPSNYTDTSNEPLISQSTKDNTLKPDIDECFVLNKVSEQKLGKNSQTASYVLNKKSQEVNKSLENVEEEKSAAIILLSDDDDEDEIDVNAINEEHCIEGSKQKLENVERASGNSKGEIKILQNIRLPNIYEIRAQQRRLREEAAKNVESKQLAAVNNGALSRLVNNPIEIGMNGKTREDREEAANYSDFQYCKGESNANQIEVYSVDGSNFNSVIASKASVTTGSDTELMYDKIYLIEEEGEKDVNAVYQKVNSVCVVKDSNNIAKNGSEAFEPKFTDLGNELKMAIENPEKSNSSVTIDSVIGMTEVDSETQAFNQEQPDDTAEANKLNQTYTKFQNNIEDPVKSGTQLVAFAEYKSSQKCVKDIQTSVQVDLTTEMALEELAKDAQHSARTIKTTTNTKIVAECSKSGDELKGIDCDANNTTISQVRNYSKKGNCAPKDASLVLVVEISDDEEIRPERETDGELKKIAENLITKDESTTGIYNHSVDKLSNEEKPPHITVESAYKQKSATEVECGVEKESAESTAVTAIKSSITKDQGAGNCSKANNNKENSDINFNEKSADECIAASNIIKDKPIADICTTLINDKTKNITDLKQSNFDCQINIDAQNVADSTNIALENKENLESIDNQTKDMGNAADKELEDAVAYLVNTMDVDSKFYLNDDSINVDMQLEDYQQSSQVIEPKDDAAYSNQNKNDTYDNPQNTSSKLELEEAHNKSLKLLAITVPVNTSSANLNLMNNANSKLMNTSQELSEDQLEVARNADRKLLPNVVSEHAKNASLDHSEDANAKVSNNAELEVSQGIGLKLLPIVATEQANNASGELLEHANEKLLNNEEMEVSQSADLKLLPNVVSKQIKNGSVEVEEEGNEKLLNNADLEVSQSTKVKPLSIVVPEQENNASGELSEHANETLLNNAELEVSQSTGLKILPNVVPKQIKNGSMEVEEETNETLLNNADLEVSQSTKVKTLSIVVPEQENNASVELSEDTNGKLLNNTELEVSQSIGLKLLPNVVPKHIKNGSMEVEEETNEKLLNNADLEVSQSTKVKSLSIAVPEQENNATVELSEDANVKLLNNVALGIRKNKEVELLPNLVPQEAKNISTELSRNQYLNIDYMELEHPKNKVLKLLPNVVPEHTENTNVKLSKNTNSKLLDNSERELSKEEKTNIVPNTSAEHTKNANMELSGSNAGLNLKMAPCPSILSTERNVLLDKMKRSEILWKFKIPKLSAKRKREQSDEDSKSNDSTVNGEQKAEDNVKKAVKTNGKINEDKPLQQQNTQCQNTHLNKKFEKTEKIHSEDKKLYLMRDEIEIVEIDDDIDLIETRLLTGQTPEEKRTLSADREKSERIIKEIDNWARRKVGDIPDIIESALLLETAQVDSIKVKERIEEKPKSSEKIDNRKAEGERKSIKTAKSNKSETKTELKNAEKTYAPLLVLTLCEQHEKENEKQLANRVEEKNVDFKSRRQGERLPSKRGKYDNATETQVKHKTDMEKRVTETKTESKAQKICSNNDKDTLESVREAQRKCERQTHDTTNNSFKANTEQSLTQSVKVDSMPVVKKAIRGSSSLEIDGATNAKKKGGEENNKALIEITKTDKVTEDRASVSKELEVKTKKSQLKDKAHVSLEVKHDASAIPKFNDQNEKDKKAGTVLKRAGDGCKTKLPLAIEEADMQEKRAKFDLDAKKIENAKTVTENAWTQKDQVPTSHVTKAESANSATKSNKGQNHSKAAATTSTDKPIATKQNIETHKRQRLDTKSDNYESEEVMPKPRKRKRCEMRIDDSDDDEYQQTTMSAKKCVISEADTTENKDILAILQNDSVNGNNESSVGGVLPGPQTPSSLPADISQDEQYKEIDSRMQLMFASPKLADKTATRDLDAKVVAVKTDAIKQPIQQPMTLIGDAQDAQTAIKSTMELRATSPLAVLKAPSLDMAPKHNDFNVSDTSFSDFNSNSFQVSSRNITIDETQVNEMDISMNSSSLSDSSLCTKHISLGSSDYRFEKVSDNVVNLFITRKCRGKRKPMANIAAAAAATTTAATTTKTNKIQTAT
ncbi:uncharacterized protein FLASH isoform X2 [Eurosta solidaginis]|uniref:uncharacterized protein FLASH isoform X2 n=1 Tax=Eurosta solidaginis TaxID=178769 RepID=UPI00353155E5